MTTQAVVFTPAARRAQAVFRAALQALARPGQISTFPEGADFPVGAARHAYALLLALADQEVTLAVTGADEPTTRFASLGTGSRLVPVPQAEYLLAVEDPGALLLQLHRGTLETPEDGATAIIAVEELGGEGLRLRLAGPGIPGTNTLAVRGISPATVAARNEACQDYPLGIDLFLVDREGRCVGIPRTTQTEMEGD
jgi:alpha-D-ribose 1-methylphosphonate 5-triphosphate synthase subunit PhnH